MSSSYRIVLITTVFPEKPLRGPVAIASAGRRVDPRRLAATCPSGGRRNPALGASATIRRRPVNSRVDNWARPRPRADITDGQLEVSSMKTKGKVWIAAIVGLILVIGGLVGVKVGQ